MTLDVLAQRVVEAKPSVRWHLGRVRTAALYRPAFGSLGRGSVIVDPRVLRGTDRLHLGDGVAVYGGAWLQAEGPTASVRIGDGTYLGHDCHVHAIDPISIGAGCVLADGVFVATTEHASANRAQVHGTGAITIGDRVFLGQRAIVLGGVTIGDGATVGAGAVVTKDVPAGVVVAGVPARPVQASGGRD